MRLPLLVLLLATVACQRATYPMQAGGGSTAQPAAPNPAAASPPAKLPVTQGPAGTPGPAASAQHSPRQFRQRIVARYVALPGSISRGRITSPVAAAAHRHLPARRRAPAMSEDTMFGLIFYGIGGLLVAAGLTLAIGLGGGLAVAGGIVLILLGLAMVLLLLYAKAFGRNMGH